MKHCQRDFKHAAPQEYESWRELYLRLHEEREERLRKLTMNISSAHANKPKRTHRWLSLVRLFHESDHKCKCFIFFTFSSAAG